MLSLTFTFEVGELIPDTPRRHPKLTGRGFVRADVSFEVTITSATRSFVPLVLVVTTGEDNLGPRRHRLRQQ